MDKTIVITGADGFIGSHLVRRLVKEHFTVHALVLPNSSHTYRIQGIEGVFVHSVFLHNWKDFIGQLPQKPEAVIHLAWKGVSPEHRGSILQQVGNLNLCLEAVQLAKALNTSRFILLGSTMEYAMSGEAIGENTPPSPLNAYGSVKVASRYLCSSLCEELNIPFIYAVVTGIYASDRKDNNVIYYTINQLLNKKKPSLTKLEQLWDYVHIDDVVEALYLIAIKGKGKTLYTIGHGDNWPLANYIFKIRDLIDPSLPLGIGEVPYSDTEGRLPSSCVDLSTLFRDTGFVPRVPFEKGIVEVIEAVKKEI